MQLLFYLAILSTNFFALRQVVAAIEQQNCGTLDEGLMDEETMNTTPLEYPWTALFANRNEETGELKYECQGVLLSKRIVLGTNYCLRDLSNNSEVLLGYWTTPKHIAAQTYKIDKILLNPYYDNALEIFLNGMVHLARDVLFGPLVQPICLPPYDLLESDLYNKRLYITGMTFFNANMLPRRLDHIKRKAFVNIRKCSSTAKFNVNKNHHLCGSLENSTNNFIGGAGIMDVRYVNNEPKYFYLVGTDTFKSDKFASIMPSLAWIKQNLD